MNFAMLQNLVRHAAEGTRVDARTRRAVRREQAEATMWGHADVIRAALVESDWFAHAVRRHVFSLDQVLQLANISPADQIVLEALAEEAPSERSGIEKAILFRLVLVNALCESLADLRRTPGETSPSRRLTHFAHCVESCRGVKIREAERPMAVTIERSWAVRLD